jgi:excisionase family DNA binding protein
MIIIEYSCILVIKRGIAMELLTVKETAEMLRVSTVTVRRYIASGKLAAVRVGRNIRIRRDDAESIFTPVRRYTEQRIWGTGRPLTFDSPIWDMVGIASDKDGKTDIAENHDKYLAEAYADNHEDDDTPFTNPDGDTTLTPREWMLKNHPLFSTLPGGPHSEDKSDNAENRDKYLAEAKARYLDEAYADTHEEDASEPLVLDVDPRFADKSDEWILENHPLLKMAGMASDREGKTDIAENHDYYLAEAYSDMHEE